MSSGRAVVSLSLGVLHVTVAGDRGVIDEVSRVFVDQIVDRPSFLRVEIGGRPGSEEIALNGRRWQGEPHHTVVDQLGYMLMRAHLDLAPSALHLHAGLVDDGTSGVLVAGLVGSGKSTLIAGLVHEGFDFHTDERVTVQPDASVVPLRKPLALTAGAYEFIDALDPTLVDRHPRGESYWHLPASAIRPHRAGDVGPVRAVVFVEPLPDGDARPDAALLTAIPRPEAISRLLADIAYGATRRADDLVAAAQLVAGATAFTVSSRDPVAVADALRRALAEAADPGVVAPIWPQPERVLGERRPRLADGVGAVRLDGMVLATPPSSGEVLQLDDVTGSWLELLDGSQTIDELVAAIAGETGVGEARVRAIADDAVRGLERAGLVASA